MIRGDGWSFTHIPKTGGSSVTAAIAFERTGEWPKEVKGWHGRYHDENAMHGGYRHVDGLRGFAFIRDPFELYLSLWWSARAKDSWLTVRQEPALIESFAAMMEFIMTDPSARKTFFRPFVEHLTCPKTGEEVEFIGRFESLQADLDLIGEVLGFYWKLPRYNGQPKKRPSLREVYTPALVEAVAENHKEDLRRFGYVAPM